MLIFIFSSKKNREAGTIQKKKDTIEKLNKQIDEKRDQVKQLKFEQDLLKKEETANDNKIKEWSLCIDSIKAEIDKLNQKVVPSPKKLKEVESFI